MTGIAARSELGVLATVRRGLQLSPEIVQGIGLTAVLAVVSAVGRVLVPFAVQRTLDDGILLPGGPDVRRVVVLTLLALLGLLVAGTCAAVVNRRLFRATEAGLASLRVRAFRHVHDLPVLTQRSERRGSLVSRVTSDVDTISQFVQWGGIMLVVSLLQVLAATALMLVYSWQLALVVWACFLPLMLVLGPAQRAVNRAYGAVRERVGTMLGAVSEAVVGAETVRVYGLAGRTGRRIDAAIRATRDAMFRAQQLVATVFSSGVAASGLAVAAVVLVGTLLGVEGVVTPGQVVAFLFLVQLFTGPVQMAAEVLNELQNAVAGWRRVIAILETPVQVADPVDGVDSPRGPAQVELRGVSFAYPGGPLVLRDVDLTIPARSTVAVVGETGSGKTTLAGLIVRLMDPTTGQVLLDGTDLRDITSRSLRRRVVLVPQDGFLFDGTLLENIAYGLRDPHGRETDLESLQEPAPGRQEAAGDLRARVAAALEDLGLADWVAGLPSGLDTAVGQRGESLSAGEQQLVAIARAYLADADLLVLDEATSAVDPATEVRIQRALDSLTTGRSAVAIAHRLSTAEAADLVVVVDDGRVVETGTHAELAAAGGVYAALHESWVAQTR